MINQLRVSVIGRSGNDQVLADEVKKIVSSIPGCLVVSLTDEDGGKPFRIEVRVDKDTGLNRFSFGEINEAQFGIFSRILGGLSLHFASKSIFPGPSTAQKMVSESDGGGIPVALAFVDQCDPDGDCPDRSGDDPIG